MPRTNASSPAAPTFTRRAFATHLGGGLLALTLATGCYGKGKNAPEPVERATVQVVNQGFLDRRVYVMRGGERVRIGTVSGNSRAVLTIPANIVQSSSSVRFVADPIGGNGAAVTEEITVRPGDQVVLTIPPG